MLSSDVFWVRVLRMSPQSLNFLDDLDAFQHLVVVSCSADDDEISVVLVACSVDDDEIEIGMGIHGEPGKAKVKWKKSRLIINELL